MSGKHCRPKRGRRSKSRYPQRLAARGLKAAPPMADAEQLAGVQKRRERETGSPWWTRGSRDEDGE